TNLLKPALAPCADTEWARFPVDAHATVSNPNSLAFVRATATTRSLNERVGWATVSSFIYNSFTPNSLARLLAFISGVNPELNPTWGSPSIGRSSLYRQRFFSRFSIFFLVNMRFILL